MSLIKDFSLIPILENLMCLGIPMQIIEINKFMARCQAKGVERDVSLFMLQHENIVVGDFVMVHVGYAIQKMSEQEALSTWELFDEILSLEDAAQQVAPQ